MTALVLGALIAVLAVLLVALPFVLRSGEDDDLHAPTEAEERRLLLIEERDHALAALKELEFDHRTGKVDDVDYRATVGPLRRAAADALRALDADSPKKGSPPPEKMTEPAPEQVQEAKE
jgi:hypothetical protein